MEIGPPDQHADWRLDPRPTGTWSGTIGTYRGGQVNLGDAVGLDRYALASSALLVSTRGICRDSLENRPNLWRRSNTKSSICVHDGEPKSTVCAVVVTNKFFLSTFCQQNCRLGNNPSDLIARPLSATCR